MENQVDALLYMGPSSVMSKSQMSPTLCADAAYMSMRVRRMTLVFPPARGGRQSPLDQLKQYCASVTAPTK
jgi:hypothetical protein